MTYILMFVGIVLCAIGASLFNVATRDIIYGIMRLSGREHLVGILLGAVLITAGSFAFFLPLGSVLNWK